MIVYINAQVMSTLTTTRQPVFICDMSVKVCRLKSLFTDPLMQIWNMDFDHLDLENMKQWISKFKYYEYEATGR